MQRQANRVKLRIRSYRDEPASPCFLKIKRSACRCVDR